MAAAGEDGSRDDDGEGEGDPWGGQEPPAEWRQRMHAARRRTMLVVVGLVRWQMAMARRPGPKRLPRVNSFSYYIPQVGQHALGMLQVVHIYSWVGRPLERIGERGGMRLPGCHMLHDCCFVKEPFSCCPTTERQVLRDEATRFIEEALAVSRIQQQQMLQEVRLILASGAWQWAQNA